MPSSRRQPRLRDRLAPLGFLAPNVLGFGAFTLFPVVLSFCMAFTNWNLKPAVRLQFVGGRNFVDLLWVRAIDGSSPTVLCLYALAALLLCAGVLGVLWTAFADVPGSRAGGVVVGLLGLFAVAVGGARGVEGVVVAGIIALAVFGAILAREDGVWDLGVGVVPAIALLFAAGTLWGLHSSMWAAYELLDRRFWAYFYNTGYLMMGIPFAIVGSLALALLVSDDLPVGGMTTRLVGTGISAACGVITTLVLFGVGRPNIAVLGAVFWAMAALGFAFNIVAFRTIYYLPTFTSGVALMMLWKALYNPETGPINAGVVAILSAFGSDAAAPRWLASVAWAKPALIIMGFWTAIGGTNFLLYLAGLSNIPPALIDAAKVDGAGRWQRFRHVLWPQLAPVTFFITVMSVIGGLQGGFEQARVMTAGGPAGSTTTLSYYVYNTAFQDLDLGYAAAISWVLFAIIFVATALNWRFGHGVDVEP